MSEKSKGDTSRVVNNPLLSASVTGLTFDDFPSAPLLLPAAPPIERSPPPVLDLNSDSKEPTNGQRLESDSDAFSEINLNATSDEDYAQPGPTSFISPLEENPSIPDSSLLSQAASSFSQLPSVASTVLSTFSKVIKDYSPTSQYLEDSNISNADTQLNATFDHFYAPEQHESSSTPALPEQPLEPPKFYSPTEIPSLPTAPSLQNTNQNTYRLSAKRKTYAPIPGLSSNIHLPTANVLPTPVATLPPPPPLQASPGSEINLPSNEQNFDSFANSRPVFNLQPAVANIQPFAEQPAKKEERKGLFSLSNVVAPVWQNLSGLVGRVGGQEEQSNIQAPQFEPTLNSPQAPVQQPSFYSPQYQQTLSTPFYSNQTQHYSFGVDKGNIPPQPAPFFTQLASSPFENLPVTEKSTPPPEASTLPTNLKKATPPPISQIFTPPGSYFPGVQKPTPPPAAVTPPTIGFSNLNLGNSPHLPETDSRPIQQLPPVGTGNTFRLQKGTRHYKTPYGISTNPSVPSNLLQPFANESPLTAVNQSFVAPFNPIPVESTVQNQVNTSFLNPVSTHNSLQGQQSLGAPQETEFNSPAQQQQTSLTSALNSTFNPPVPNSFPFSTVAAPQASSSPYQPDQLQNCFSPQQSLKLPSTPPLSQQTFTNQPDFSRETNTGTFYSDNKANSLERNQNTDFPSGEDFSFDGKVFEDENSAAKVNNFENQTVKAELDTYASVSDKEREENVNNFTTEKQEANYTDVALEATNLTTEPASVTNENQTIQSLDNHHQNFEENVTISTNISTEPFGKLLFGKESIPVFQPLPNQNVPTQSFSLTNYFSAQAGIEAQQYTQPQPDFNANPYSKESVIVPSPSATLSQEREQAAVSFFSQNYSGEDNKNNNANSTLQNLPDPISFFDSFHEPKPSSSPVLNQIDENLNSSADGDTKSEIDNSFQIQNFFNNPPQTLNTTASDLNYKLVGSNLIKKKYTDNLSSRPISPSSNVVEPPSSACSEFSADTNFQNPGNLSKPTNVDIPDELRTELGDPLDPEIMAMIASSKSNATANTVYQPAVKHWFYKKKVDEKFIWTPFSHHDSALIESHYNDPAAPKVVGVEGGRYDVNIDERLRLPIFWSGEATEVRRCSWFYKAVDSRYVPYDESVADKLEVEYEDAFKSGEWHRKISLPTGELVVFHGPSVMVHYHQIQASDSWGASTQTTSRSRIVKRDLEDFNIETSESNRVDHLLFMVHGIGSVCDLKFRTVEEVVDEFRNIATQLVQSHYKNSCESGRVGRVEVLPVSWHSELHSEESGVDEKLKAITLESIPKLRNFTNDTLLDILFYTSPVFCQNIMDTVAGTMNKVYSKYCQRNPTFNGGVSLAGHSLGSLILFDLLCHQKSIDNAYIQNSENPDQPITPLQIRAQTPTNEENMTSKQISYTIGPAGTGQPFISYPQLVFQPKKFFALGSPIGMFVTIRGIDRLGMDFKLPTCPGFYNIFHPYDPVAYRVEALVNTDLSSARPVLIPHHKGRKRLHLELKETMTRVGADIKQKIVDTFKNTFGTVYQLTSKQKPTPDPGEIEREVDKVLEMQLKMDKEARSRTNSTSTHSDVDTGEVDLPLGNLNEGKRIDYVLQEAPLEFFNEYLFALTSHVCYWESADTILFLMKEIYSSLGVQTDIQVPQQSMTIERPASTSLLHNDLCENPDDHN